MAAHEQTGADSCRCGGLWPCRFARKKNSRSKREPEADPYRLQRVSERKLAASARKYGTAQITTAPGYSFTGINREMEPAFDRWWEALCRKLGRTPGIEPAHAAYHAGHSVQSYADELRGKDSSHVHSFPGGDPQCGTCGFYDVKRDKRVVPPMLPDLATGGDFSVVHPRAAHVSPDFGKGVPSDYLPSDTSPDSPTAPPPARPGLTRAEPYYAAWNRIWSAVEGIERAATTRWEPDSMSPDEFILWAIGELVRARS